MPPLNWSKTVPCHTFDSLRLEKSNVENYSHGSVRTQTTQLLTPEYVYITSYVVYVCKLVSYAHENWQYVRALPTCFSFSPLAVPHRKPQCYEINMKVYLYIYVQNVDTCGFMDDETCINMCRSNFLTLPSVCDICNRKRPILFIDMDEIISRDGVVIQRDLEQIVANRLSTYVTILFVYRYMRNIPLTQHFVTGMLHETVQQSVTFMFVMVWDTINLCTMCCIQIKVQVNLLWFDQTVSLLIQMTALMNIILWAMRHT